MAHGLIIYDSSGAQLVGLSSKLGRLLFSASVAADASGGATVSAYDSNKGVHFSVIDENVVLDGFEGEIRLPHTVTFNNTSKMLSWTPASASGYRLASRVYVWMYS